MFLSLRRLSGATTSRTCAALACPSRTLSTLELEDDETHWRHRNQARYGEGNYPLFRALYKELCDEVRREFFTKPPPPFAAHLGSTTAAPSTKAAEGASARAEPPKKPDVTYGDGSWRVEYRPENNVVVFRREAVQASRMARVVAYTRVAVEDPPRLNAMLTFADWYPFEVLIERKGIIVHFSVACNEGGMHMRNCRVYDAEALTALATETRNSQSDASHPGTSTSSSTTDAGSAAPTDAADASLITGVTDDAEWVRQNLLYDGPCLWHLELSFQNELYDIMQDHGIDLDWLRWGSEWVFYLEHFMYTRWCLGMLDQLIPTAARGGEEDFLLKEEQALLDEPAEDWLAPHAM